MGIAFNDNFGTIAYNGVFYPANSGGGIVPPVIEGKKLMPFLIKTDINAINYNCNCIISNAPIDDAKSIEWNITNRRSTSAGYIQFQELCFYDENKMPISFTIISTSYENVTPTSAGEAWDKALDGNLNTKCCCSWNMANPAIFRVNLTFNKNPKYYAFYTGNDADGRDPISWTMNINGKIVDTQIDIADKIPTTRKTCTPLFTIGE